MSIANHSGKSLFMPLEDKLRQLLLPHVPAWCGTRVLTMLSLLWSAGVVLAFRFNYIIIVIALVWAQYVTDMMDGAVGRARKEGWVRWGYFMDHLLDYVFVGAMFVGYAIWFPTESTIWVMCIFIIAAGFMVTIFLLTAATGNLRIHFFGVGPTEFRLFFTLLQIRLIVVGPVRASHLLPLQLVAFSVVLIALVVYCQRALAVLDVKDAQVATTSGREAFGGERERE